MTIKELEKEIREKTTVLDKDELKKVIKYIDELCNDDVVEYNDTINHLKKRTVTIKLEHPTTEDSMSGGWSESHKSKAPTKKEITSELENHLYDLGFDVHKINVQNTK